MSTAFSIGDFSRATHLTVKTLRHYHEMGLLVPSSVDRRTGYRRYSAEQISIAQIIRRFRRLDMPVSEIQTLLATSNPSARNELIAAHLRRLETELSHTQEAVASLRELLERPATDLGIERRRIERSPVAAIRETIRAKDALSWLTGAMAELRAAARAQRLAQTGVPGGVFANSVFAQGRGEATLFIPCEGSIRATARVSACVLPEAEVAALVHEGSHASVDRTYGALATYVAKHALPLQGPIREYYLVGPWDTADETAWRTEIGWPIFHTG